MCVVCKEWELGKLNSREAMKNLSELIGMRGEADRDPKVRHYYEAIDKIIDKEVPFNEEDQELNKSWHDETHED